MAIRSWTMLGAVFGLALLIAGVAHVAKAAAWEAYYRELLLAFAGWSAFVFSDDLAEYTGRHGWTRNQWRQSPAWSVKLAGAAVFGWNISRILQWV